MIFLTTESESDVQLIHVFIASLKMRVEIAARTL